MRASSPVPDSFSVLNPVEDEAKTPDPTNEMKQLAKAAKSPDGKIILDHLQNKINQYTDTLKNTDLASYGDNVVALATVMCWQKMIKEFEVVLNDVAISTQAVADANKAKLSK